MVQVATAATAPAQPAQISSTQTAQIVTANGTVIGSATIPPNALQTTEGTMTVEGSTNNLQVCENYLVPKKKNDLILFGIIEDSSFF